MDSPLILYGAAVLALMPLVLLLRIHALLAEIVRMLRERRAAEPAAAEEAPAPAAPTPAGRSCRLRR